MLLLPHAIYFSLCSLKDWRKFEIRIECTEQQCVMLAMVHLRVSVMTQRWTVRAIHTCIISTSRPLCYDSICLSINLLIPSSYSPIPCSPPSPPPLHHLPPGAPHAGVRAVDWSVCFTGSCPQSWSVVVNEEWLFQVEARDQDPSEPLRENSSMLSQ